MKVGESTTFYCVRCRAKRTAAVKSIDHKKNADLLMSNCATCKTKMCRFAGRTKST